MTDAQVRRIAKLARLAITDEQASAYRTRLAATLAYFERLREMDLSGIEPMANPAAMVDRADSSRNRLDEDVVGPMLPTQALMRMAPASALGAYVRVPRVLDEGGGA